MQIGSAWTKTEEKEGKKNVTGISLTLDDAITEIYPQLKTVKFLLKPLTPEQRTKDNSPHWKLIMYKPQEQTTSSNIATEEIPY